MKKKEITKAKNTYLAGKEKRDQKKIWLYIVGYPSRLSTKRVLLYQSLQMFYHSKIDVFWFLS